MPAMHDFLFRAVLLLVPMILSLTVHEYAHAFVADRLGDDTPRLQGRLTLDPRPHIHPLGTLLLPLLILMVAGLSLGFGIIFSSLTTKYRDLTFLLQFGVQLWMYITPVIYPLQSIPADKQWMLLLNPMTSIIETFKYGFMGAGVFNWFHLLYSFIFMLILLFLGIIIFNKVEKGFMDTV